MSASLSMSKHTGALNPLFELRGVRSDSSQSITGMPSTLMSCANAAGRQHKAANAARIFSWHDTIFHVLV